MPEYQLYCFAQSGNAYRAALMLNLIGADWKPVYVDFFKAARRARPKYRAEVNEMGEVPVLVHGDKKLTQSGVILTYLSEHSGKFKPEGEDERLEALRWIIFDNQKVNGFLGPYRFLKNFARPAGRSRGDGVPQGPHRRQSRHRRQAARRPPFVLGDAADHRRHFAVRLSLLSGGGIRLRHCRQHKNIGAWLDRIKALPGWKHPYELMPGHPPQLVTDQRAVRPPSMTNSAPVTKRDLSDNR